MKSFSSWGMIETKDWQEEVKKKMKQQEEQEKKERNALNRRYSLIDLFAEMNEVINLAEMVDDFEELKVSIKRFKHIYDSILLRGPGSYSID